MPHPRVGGGAEAQAAEAARAAGPDDEQLHVLRRLQQRRRRLLVPGVAVDLDPLGQVQLVNQMRSEQKVVREWVDEQAQQQVEVANMLRTLTDAMKRGAK